MFIFNSIIQKSIRHFLLRFLRPYVGPGLVTAVRGIYAELQMSKRGKVLKIEKDSSNALAVYFILIIVYI